MVVYTQYAVTGYIPLSILIALLFAPLSFAPRYTLTDDMYAESLLEGGDAHNNVQLSVFRRGVSGRASLTLTMTAASGATIGGEI